ncbi:hypothetical protein C8J56DRAFT_1067259 [Mycena floridula]|nr:hypothetical protein C8J56DRAFT_1067259 [Mycena floridula]
MLHIPLDILFVWPLAFWTLGTREGDQLATKQSNERVQDAFKRQILERPDRPSMWDCLQDRVGETKPNSFGSGFAAAGGGVYAMQFDTLGIYIWFWSRKDIPASVTHATSASNMDTLDWGMPSASCVRHAADGPPGHPPSASQGAWAGIQSLYSLTRPGSCILNIVDSRTPVYNDAWFDIAYIQTFIAAPLQPSTTEGNATPTSGGPSPDNGSSDGSVTTTGSGEPSATSTNGAVALRYL